MSEISSKVTDAVSQTDVSVVAQSPTINMGTTYLTSSHATGLMFQNAVGNQQQQYSLFQSGTAKQISNLYRKKSIHEALRLAQQLQSES